MEHIARHGVDPEEAEEVVLTGVQRKGREGTMLASGPTSEGRYLLVVYVKKEKEVFVITARDMTEREKSKWKKRYGKRRS